MGPASEPGFVVDLDAPADLARYLKHRAWLATDDTVVSVAPAGDGNMNCTLRVVSHERRLIVKQGRPWVQKYPDIPAPRDRTLVEARFYELLPTHLVDRMPRYVGVDPSSRVLVLQDCEGFTDLTSLYEGHPLERRALDELLGYLRDLHRIDVPDGDREVFANDAMRALNHEYIFCLPLAADASLLSRLEGITPGLADLARALSHDAAYVSRSADLGRVYSSGAARALLHGDFFPGSWLFDGARVKIIDPEFCFVGAPEFDYGVMAAHLMLAGQAPPTIDAVGVAAETAGCDAALTAGFAGIELMRRLLGVAQLPRLHRTLAEKRTLLDVSRRLVLGESVLGSA